MLITIFSWKTVKKNDDNFFPLATVKKFKSIVGIKLNTSFLIRCKLAKDCSTFDLVSPTKPYSTMFEYKKKHDFHNYLTDKLLKICPWKHTLPPILVRALFSGRKIQLRKLSVHVLSDPFVNMYFDFTCCLDSYFSTVKIILFAYGALAKNLNQSFVSNSTPCFAKHCSSFDLVSPTKPCSLIFEYTKKHDFY